jgi:muconolactone delta-isomerase
VEFLIAHTITVPKGTPSQTVNEARTRETERAREPAEQDTCSGSGRRPPNAASGAFWVPGEPATLPRCRRSWSHCPFTLGQL